KIACPKNADERTSQVTFSHPDAQKIMQKVIARGVVADFRPPNVMRFGMAPLYNSFEDIYKTVMTLKDVLGD
ncbi:MAG: kynureninase/PvdN C-terminal domain-containing protein, partial [Alphaproteobacteria bacterium]